MVPAAPYARDVPSRIAAVVAVTLVVALSACGPSALLDLSEVAGEAEAPPPDAVLAPGGAPAAAAWIQRATQRTDAPVVVKFFASWCRPCEEEVPVLQAARDRHPGVTFLGVAHEDPPDDARAWMAEQGIEDLPTLLDLEGSTARTFAARGMPSVSFVDPEGQLLHTHTGPIDARLLDDWIAHLEGRGPRPSARPDAPAGEAARAEGPG